MDGPASFNKVSEDEFEPCADCSRFMREKDLLEHQIAQLRYQVGHLRETAETKQVRMMQMLARIAAFRAFIADLMLRDNLRVYEMEMMLVDDNEPPSVQRRKSPQKNVSGLLQKN